MPFWQSDWGVVGDYTTAHRRDRDYVIWQCSGPIPGYTWDVLDRQRGTCLCGVVLRRYKEVIVPAHTTKQLTEVVCDRCAGPVEAEGQYDMREFTLEHKIGKSYPSESYVTDGWEVEDLCNNCIQVLRNILIDNGFKLKELG